MSANLYRCGPRLAKKYVLKALYAGLVPFLQSSPGVGKSSIMRAIAKELNLFLIDHRLSTSPPEDMSGLPRFDADGFAYFAPFRELFPLQGAKVPEGYSGWLIFLDEFNSARKETQAAAYKLILDRMVGQHVLHDNCLIACAGNLSTDRAIVNPLSTAMQSRVVHIELEVNFDEWLMDVALKENYSTRIIAYLSQYPGELMDFRPEHQERTFCCPRTWEFMEKLTKDEEELQDEFTGLYAGTITSGIAAKFVQFTKVYASMPSIEGILKDPEGHHMPSDLNTRWAVVSSLLEHTSEKTLGPLSKFVNRMDLSFKVLFFRSVMVRNPDLQKHPAFSDALLQLAKYLRG